MVRKRSVRESARRKHVAHKAMVSLEEAKEQVEIAMTRAALLHLSFSRILVNEFGEDKGKELVVRAIMEYGKRVGERVKRGLLDLPKYGVIGKEIGGGSGNKRFESYRAYDCVFAKTFKEYGELDLGAL